MCGVLGIVGKSWVNQALYDGLLMLQHRGQDAAGIVTCDGTRFFEHKNNGLVRDVFHTRHMRNLPGHLGIAHVRYPTAGSSSKLEAQPLYVNSPLGIVLAHNGNLSNAYQLEQEVCQQDLRHINTESDSEILLNVLAHEIAIQVRETPFNTDVVFNAMTQVYRRCHGGYAVVAMIAGFGLLAFRDPNGVRPLIIGYRDSEHGRSYAVASESVALDVLGYTVWRDVAPGEVIFINTLGEFFSKQCVTDAVHAPCIFEYVYLARPDSVLDGVSVYQARLNMGIALAEKIKQQWSHLTIDVVIPIPDTSRPSALQLANVLQKDYREGFIKNRYIGRTFIMPGQQLRERSVSQKLNPMGVEFAGKNVLLVDDSIVRGTTSREIVQMARDAGAKQVYFASASPPVRYPNVYGIDMPSREELLATGRSDKEICAMIGADALIYQDLDALISSVQQLNPAMTHFDTSCFDGHYVTGDISAVYLKELFMRNRRRVAVNRIQRDGDDEQVQFSLNELL